MLPTNLTTNEVKDSAGSEIEFLRLDQTGRTLTFAKSGEAPNLQHRLSISHLEIGSGVAERRRSKVGVSKEILGASGTKRVINVYVVADIPVGDIDDYNDVKTALANLNSFLSTTGVGTTVLFDCSGYGSASLVAGSL